MVIGEMVEGLLMARCGRLHIESRIFLFCELQAMPHVISSAVPNLCGDAYSGSWRALLHSRFSSKLRFKFFV